MRNILTEVLPYLNIYMTEELSEKELAELEALNIAVKKANITNEEDEEEVSTQTEPETSEDGTIDANGGDTTSSTPVSEEEMGSDDVLTAPLTNNMLLNNADPAANAVNAPEEGTEEQTEEGN